MLKRLIDIDHRWSELFRLKNDGFLLKTSKILAHSGDSWIWFPALLFVFVINSGFWGTVAFQFLLGVLFSAILVTTLKYTFRRARPAGTWGKMYRFYDPHSFPSGHAARVFAIAFLSFSVASIWVACLILLWAILVSLSRIVNGVHYFSDILAGGFVGILAGIITLLTF